MGNWHWRYSGITRKLASLLSKELEIYVSSPPLALRYYDFDTNFQANKFGRSKACADLPMDSFLGTKGEKLLKFGSLQNCNSPL